MTRHLHIFEMRTDFSVFRERLTEACRARDVKAVELSLSTGLSPRRILAARLTGPGALDLYRVCQIADVLGVSVDWLVGRSDAMEMAEQPKRKAKKAR